LVRTELIIDAISASIEHHQQPSLEDEKKMKTKNIECLFHYIDLYIYLSIRDCAAFSEIPTEAAKQAAPPFDSNSRAK
jgi:hypothetical protein